MSEPESKKLEERLAEWLEELSGYRPFQDDQRRDLLHETMRALREKDDALMEAWGIIANAGAGNWERESADWQKAAHVWGVKNGYRLP